MKSNKKISLVTFFVTLFILVYGCTSGKNEPSTVSNNEELSTTEFLKGKTLFEQRCSNCHRADGKGMGTLYPPIAGSDYLKGNKEKIICMIKYGANEEIIVNGVKYKMQMLGQHDLNEVEISDIMNYIYNAWGNNLGPIELSEVEKRLANCKN